MFRERCALPASRLMASNSIFTEWKRIGLSSGAWSMTFSITVSTAAFEGAQINGRRFSSRRMAHERRLLPERSEVPNRVLGLSTWVYFAAGIFDKMERSNFFFDTFKGFHRVFLVHESSTHDS